MDSIYEENRFFKDKLEEDELTTSIVPLTYTSAFKVGLDYTHFCTIYTQKFPCHGHQTSM